MLTYEDNHTTINFQGTKSFHSGPRARQMVDDYIIKNKKSPDFKKWDIFVLYTSGDSSETVKLEKGMRILYQVNNTHT